MKTVNACGEPIHLTRFARYEQARHFTKMLGKNHTRFSLIGTHQEHGQWVVVYRSRKTSPWQRDARGKGVSPCVS